MGTTTINIDDLDLDIEFQPIEMLDSLMTEEQKAQSQAAFEKYYPPGTPEIMCTSQEEGDGSQYLVKVDLKDFE